MLTLLAQAAPAAPPVATSAANSNTMLFAALVLIGAAAALFVVEVFVPSGGILGIISALCLAAGSACMFGVNTAAGLITSALAIAAVPVALYAAMRLMPHTPIGQWLTLGQTLADPATTNPEHRNDQVAVGDTGTALTDLRPVGACRINGHRLECLAIGPAIEPGQTVQVIAAEGFETRVRALD
ncbi:MAG: NfeD family protein [Planctomycetota bacterium]